MHVSMFRLGTYPRVYMFLLPKWETETRFLSFPSKQWRNTIAFPESLPSCLQMLVIAFFAPINRVDSARTACHQARRNFFQGLRVARPARRVTSAR